MKTVEKRVKWETGREKEEEKERRESWEAQRAESLSHDTANVVGILLAISRPPLHEQRPCSNRLGKNKKKNGKTRIKGPIMTKPSKVISTTSHSAVQFSTKRTTWDRQRSCKIGPTTAKKNTENATKLTAHSAHPTVQNSQKCHKTKQKRQFDVQN